VAGGSHRLDRIASVTAALGLTPHFRTIIATDASPRQIAHARFHPKVTYLVGTAEPTPPRRLGRSGDRRPRPPLVRSRPLLCRCATGGPTQWRPRLLDLPPPNGQPRGRCRRSTALCRYPRSVLVAAGSVHRGRLPFAAVPVRGVHPASFSARARMGHGPHCRLLGHVIRLPAIPQRDRSRPHRRDPG